MLHSVEWAQQLLVVQSSSQRVSHMPACELHVSSCSDSFVQRAVHRQLPVSGQGASCTPPHLLVTSDPWQCVSVVAWGNVGSWRVEPEEGQSRTQKTFGTRVQVKLKIGHNVVFVRNYTLEVNFGLCTKRKLINTYGNDCLSVAQQYNGTISKDYYWVASVRVLISIISIVIINFHSGIRVWREDRLLTGEAADTKACTATTRV